MRFGGSDCCATCWFNRSNGGERGLDSFNEDIPSYCELRRIDILSPFYTYCANHPDHRGERDPAPLGPAYVCVNPVTRALAILSPSPDTEEVRRHLLEMVSSPDEYAPDDLPLHPAEAFQRALDQLVEFRDERVLGALEQLIERVGPDKGDMAARLLSEARRSLGPRDPAA